MEWMHVWVSVLGYLLIGISFTLLGYYWERKQNHISPDDATWLGLCSIVLIWPVFIGMVTFEYVRGWLRGDPPDDEG